jgi:hypothetical protein
MAGITPNGGTWRNNPFSRNSASPSPLQAASRPQSAILSPPLASSQKAAHDRHQSLSGLNAPLVSNSRNRAFSSRGSTPTSNTFAPQFIKTEDERASDHAIRGIEGENDFSGKRYVWMKDPEAAFVRGWIVEEQGRDLLLVQCDDGTVSRSPRSPDENRLKQINSSVKSPWTAWTRSIQPNSTRRMTWPNSLTSTRLPWSTISICGTKQTLYTCVNSL